MTITTRIAALAAAAAIALTGLTTQTASAADADVYTTPGGHNVNGRLWNTDCSQYSSSVIRCRTEIFANFVVREDDRYVRVHGWAFNNLTYLPSDRAQWAGNPLAKTGSFTKDGREWRTECDTATTGRGGCRSYIEASVIVKTGTGFAWQKKEIFNSMVRFGAVQAPPVDETPDLEEIEMVAIDIADVPAVVGAWEAFDVDGSVVYVDPNSEVEAAVVVMAFGDAVTVAELASELTATQKLGTAVCGTLPEEGDVCVFPSAKYGTAVTVSMDASKVELHAVTAAVAARLA